MASEKRLTNSKLTFRFAQMANDHPIRMPIDNSTKRHKKGEVGLRQDWDKGGSAVCFGVGKTPGATKTRLPADAKGLSDEEERGFSTDDGGVEERKALATSSKVRSRGGSTYLGP